MTRTLPLALACALACSLTTQPAPARADDPPPTRSFAAEPAAAPTAPAAPVTADELPAMLKQCDAQLRTCERGAELCEKDRTGVGFLGAAYLGLWALLLGYFFVMRRRQQKLVADLRALEARLARLSGEGR